ncbi:MAG: hypothetical protein K5919_04620 [Clostridiales bacterium]|nr:hypothetical protein [Clostridiales bacterium]
MRLIKCPRCELNYIAPEEGYCKVCKREMKGEKQQDEIEMCTICNEAPALPGKDVCLFCLKEMNANAGRAEDDAEEEPVDEASLGIDPVSGMDEIIPEIDEDIPQREYDEIENDLSLEEMGEDEAEGDEDEEDEE